MEKVSGKKLQEVSGGVGTYRPRYYEGMTCPKCKKGKLHKEESWTSHTYTLSYECDSCLVAFVDDI